MRPSRPKDSRAIRKPVDRPTANLRTGVSKMKDQELPELRAIANLAFRYSEVVQVSLQRMRLAQRHRALSTSPHSALETAVESQDHQEQSALHPLSRYK